MVISIGNSYPSRCTALSSRRVLRMFASPVSTKRLSPRQWSAWKRSGMIVSASTRPIASRRDQPKVTSACGFQSVMNPPASMQMYASWAFSTAERALCSDPASPSMAAAI